MVTRGSKLLVAIGERHPQLVGAYDRLSQNIAAQRMEAAGGGIHHHQPLGGKGLGDELRKSLPQALALPIAGGKLIEHRSRTKQFRRLGNQLLNCPYPGSPRRPRPPSPGDDARPPAAMSSARDGWVT